MPTLGLYLHIPFCRSKCRYCDFCSVPHAGAEKMEAYAARLRADLAAHAEACRADTVDSVYFGGGTPTCLPADTLGAILDTVRSRYRVTPDAEITTECNPGTVTPEDLRRLRQSGFNRLSLGLQSAQPGELRALGRLHGFAAFADVFRAAREAGFANISADVMFGIPHQTLQSFADTLEQLCGLQPDHVSAYALTVEDGTPFGRRGAAALDLPGEDSVREMYLLMVRFLREHGLAQYEISNFARPGYESRHNLKYWTMGEYLGFGPAAYSDFGGERFGNSRDLDAYLAGQDILSERETPTPLTRESERVMLGLRLCRGMDAAELGPARCRFLARYIPAGLVRQAGTRYSLTPEGMLVSNAILSELVDFSEDSSVK